MWTTTDTHSYKFQLGLGSLIVATTPSQMSNCCERDNTRRINTQVPPLVKTAHDIVHFPSGGSQLTCAFIQNTASKGFVRNTPIPLIIYLVLTSLLKYHKRWPMSSLLSSEKKQPPLWRGQKMNNKYCPTPVYGLVLMYNTINPFANTIEITIRTVRTKQK